MPSLNVRNHTNTRPEGTTTAAVLQLGRKPNAFWFAAPTAYRFDYQSVADWSVIAEAFPTLAMRNAALGVAGDVEFVIADWRELELGGFSAATCAIGPSIVQEGFDEVADMVIPAVMDSLLEKTFGGFSGWIRPSSTESVIKST